MEPMTRNKNLACSGPDIHTRPVMKHLEDSDSLFVLLFYIFPHVISFKREAIYTF